MALVSTRDLAIGYESPLQESLSFELLEGELLVVNGPNGCGKSTFLNTVLGKTRPLKGQVDLGADSMKMELLPQIVSYNLPFSVSLGEILEAYGVSEKFFSLFEGEFLQKKWSEASGGEKQKVLILSRIGTHCDVLVLDEPFNHLDQASIKKVEDFLAELLKSGDVGSMIMVSHIPPKFDGDLPVKELTFQ